MTLRRFATRLGILVLTTGLASAVFAADTHQATRGDGTKRPRHHARSRATSKESEVARQERERREDLERRIERLEQRYELEEPALPGAEEPPAGHRVP